MANSRIADEYQVKLSALSGQERVSRCVAHFNWVREMIARQILSETADISDERLRWEVALRLYGADQSTRRMIERKLADVPR